MNRTSVIAGLFALCAGAAWLGWHFAVGGREENSTAARSVPRPVPVEAPKPAADYAGLAGSKFDARKGRPLSDILAMAERLRLDATMQSSPSTEMNGELLALLDALEPDEIKPALEFLQKMPAPQPIRMIRAVLARWASFDAPAAMAWAGKLTAAQQDEVRGAILSAWAHRDPQTAWQWYQTAFAAAPEPRYKLERDFPLLIHAWALQDPRAALDACLAEGKHGTFDPWYGLGSLACLPEHRDTLMPLLTGIPDEKLRSSAIRAALLNWAGSSPAEAAAWLDQYEPGKSDGNFVWSIAERFGRADPRANADWLLRRTPPDKRDDAYQYSLHQWSRMDPEAAGSWLETAGPTDMSSQIMATAWAGRDLDRAITWAQRVSSPKRAEAVAGAIVSARNAGKTPEISKYAAAAGLTPDALTKRVDELQKEWGRRL